MKAEILDPVNPARSCYPVLLSIDAWPTTRPRNLTATPEPAAETELYTPEAPSRRDRRQARRGLDRRGTQFSRSAAPTPPPGFVPRPPVRRDQRPQALPPGAKIDDFEIVRMLGRGAFGHVYLARQVSLDRVGRAQDLGQPRQRRPHDGPARARPHRAGVFRESRRGHRPAAALHAAGAGRRARKNHRLDRHAARSAALASRQRSPTTNRAAATWRGSDLLAIIDVNASLPTALDPAALRDREALAEMDAVEATAWIGARLGRSARLRPPARRPAPRHQAGQHPGEPLRPADARRLQHLVAAGRGRRRARCSAARSPTWPPSISTPSTRPTTRPKPPSPHGPTSIRSASCSTSCSTAGGRSSRSIRTSAWSTASARSPTIAARSRRALTRSSPALARRSSKPFAAAWPPIRHDRFATGAELAEQLEGCRQMRHAERALPAGDRHRALDHRPAVPVVRAAGGAAADRRQRDQHHVQHDADRRATSPNRNRSCS